MAVQRVQHGPAGAGKRAPAPAITARRPGTGNTRCAAWRTAFSWPGSSFHIAGSAGQGPIRNRCTVQSGRWRKRSARGWRAEAAEAVPAGRVSARWWTASRISRGRISKCSQSISNPRSPCFVRQAGTEWKGRRKSRRHHVGGGCQILWADGVRRCAEAPPQGRGAPGSAVYIRSPYHKSEPMHREGSRVHRLCDSSVRRLSVWLSGHEYFALLYMNQGFAPAFGTEEGKVSYVRVRSDLHPRFSMTDGA